MKIPYKHFIKHIDKKPDIDDLSEKLFQLGHEHSVSDGVFDMEITPNRGDCLSLNGLLRDLNLFYKISFNKDIYPKNIPSLPFKFLNEARDACMNISFIKIDIEDVPKNYKNSFGDYFKDLGVKKNNFFTDVSNYISYETGQPTHCYDAKLIHQPLKLRVLDCEYEFETLIDKTIKLNSGDLVFSDENEEVINLAGVVGGKKTSCSANTKSVIVECAYFDPESIIGRSVKYDLNSDAAHKFERNVDPYSHEFVIRRFIKIVENHANIENIQFFQQSFQRLEKKYITFDHSKINKILGTFIDEVDCISYLKKLGFIIDKNIIDIPSYRNDINTINDIAEEIARATGYDNINRKSFNISINKEQKVNKEENKIKKLLVSNGFYEVINNPFVSEGSKDSFAIDNPLDSNRSFLRANLKNSLIKNLVYNERRQKESIKLFEISDLYLNKDRFGSRSIGIIASGRVGKNYLDFSKKINNGFLSNILEKISNCSYKIENISRESIKSKSKNQIVYCEFEIGSSFVVNNSYDDITIKDISSKRYNLISEFPSSYRDLSFSVKKLSQSKVLEKQILNFKSNLLKDVFVFDYYKNNEKHEIKIGFRLIFQSHKYTITDDEVNKVMDAIIINALKLDSISIPGLR